MSIINTKGLNNGISNSSLTYRGKNGINEYRTRHENLDIASMPQDEQKEVFTDIIKTQKNLKDKINSETKKMKNATSDLSKLINSKISGKEYDNVVYQRDKLEKKLKKNNLTEEEKERFNFLMEKENIFHAEKTVKILKEMGIIIPGGLENKISEVLTNQKLEISEQTELINQIKSDIDKTIKTETTKSTGKILSAEAQLFFLDIRTVSPLNKYSSTMKSFNEKILLENESTICKNSYQYSREKFTSAENISLGLTKKLETALFATYNIAADLSEETTIQVPEGLMKEVEIANTVYPETKQKGLFSRIVNVFDSNKTKKNNAAKVSNAHSKIQRSQKNETFISKTLEKFNESPEGKIELQERVLRDNYFSFLNDTMDSFQDLKTVEERETAINEMNNILIISRDLITSLKDLDPNTKIQEEFDEICARREAGSWNKIDDTYKNKSATNEKTKDKKEKETDGSAPVPTVVEEENSAPVPTVVEELRVLLPYNKGIKALPNPKKTTQLLLEQKANSKALVTTNKR